MVKRLNLMKMAFVVLLALLLTPMTAHATLFTFYRISKDGSGNNSANAAIGESQLWVDVTNPGGGKVLFTFGNTGSNASSICDVYFDDGNLLSIASLLDADDPLSGPYGDSGVDFSELAKPSNLPDHNSVALVIPFITTAGFSADSDSPVQPNGVNPGETLGIYFSLLPGTTFDGVLVAMSLPGDPPDPNIPEPPDRTWLRIGIKVQGFADGGSEAFVNDPEPIPEPGTLLLLGSGLVGLAGYGKLRFRRKRK